MPMERAVYTYSNLVKILILTKGVEKVDTLSRNPRRDSSCQMFHKIVFRTNIRFDLV